jgi:hypothetical protein
LQRLSDRHGLGVPRFSTRFRLDVAHLRSAETIYLKTTAESGHPRAQAFCPRCGSPIYSTSPGEGQQASYMIRVGILRQRKEFVPRRQIWFRSAQPWIGDIAPIAKSEKQG